MYPHLIQACRVTAATVSGPTGPSSSPGPTLYVSFTQQVRSDLLTPRDREACLVFDLNGTALTAGYYICRLTGSYTGLPVYEAMARASSGSGITSINDNSVVDQTIGITDIAPGTPGDNELSVYTSALSAAPAWSAATLYLPGWVVTYTGKQWRAIATNENTAPPNANWVECTGDGINVLSIPKGRIYTPDGNKAIAGINDGATPTPVPAGQNFNFKTANSNLAITTDDSTSDVTFNARGGVTVINVTDITNFNTYIENVIYFNFFDKKIYININNFWYEFCICGSGVGSGGSGTGVGSIVTDCCPDTLLPTTLYGTITAKTGTCTCLPNTLTFTYIGGSEWYSNVLTTCSYEGFLILACSGGVWSLQNASVATGTLISTVCSPVLEIVFDMTADPATCTGTFTVTIST